MTDAPGVALMVGLMAAQFGVHAAGWAMAAAMQRNALGAEAHFAGFWALVAAALGAYLGFVRGSAGHAAGDVLMALAAFVLHRGILRFYRQDLPDRAYAAAAIALVLFTVLSFLAADGERWRSAAAAAVIAVAAGATGWAAWSNGRSRARVLALAAGMMLGAAALLFAGRALQAVLDPEPHRGALDIATAIALFFLAGLFNLAQIRLVLGRVLARLVAETQRDPLTGVANRRGFMQALDTAHRRALRSGERYGLLMVDIDHFKRINDERGHAAGDDALRALAAHLQHSVRAGDTVGRLGGEEFCLLLPACDLGGAHGLAERVCAGVAQASQVTVSIGVALVDAGSEGADAGLARADAALYRAKNEGRNRVVVATAAPSG